MVLICCILVNISPIRAKALAVETGIAIGIIAALIAAAAGVAFHPQTADDFVAIGNSFSDHMLNWKDESGNVVVSEEWLIGLKIFDQATSGGEDPGDPKDYRVQLARGLLAGISAWCASIILGMIDIAGTESTPDGYSYYGDTLLPTHNCSLFSQHPTRILNLNDKGQYTFYTSDRTITAKSVTYENALHYTWGFGGSCWIHRLQDDGTYKCSTSTLNSTGLRTYSGDTILWSNVDIYLTSGVNLTTTLFSKGTEPVTYSEKILVPYYVGDIPQQVQDGEIDEEDIPLPLEIDYSKLFENTGVSTAQEAVQKTLEQLSTGQITYDQFMDSIKSDSSVDSGDSGSTEETQPVVDPDVWTPPSDPGAFALDLSEIFPFCIPFDLYDFLTCLNADPVAPVIQWEVPLPGGGAYPLELDLSPFDSVAQLLRRLQLLLFCVALAMKTRDLIKG